MVFLSWILMFKNVMGIDLKMLVLGALFREMCARSTIFLERFSNDN